MPVLLHRCARVRVLADALAARLAEPPADPFAGELIVVPAQGVERWLSQRLSHTLGRTQRETADGVAANITFCSLRALLSTVVGAGDDDPWRPEAMVWPLLEVIDGSLGEPWARALTRHLGAAGIHGDDDRRGRRWAVAYRLAKRFDNYAVQRPDMLIDWEAGNDSDGLGGAVAHDLAWQAEVWRRLEARVGQPSPPQRLELAAKRLRADPRAFTGSARLSYFGPTLLPRSHVTLVQALAVHREVNVWIPHPSPTLWDRLSERGAAGPVKRTDDDSHSQAEHPLLSSLGRDLRELQRSLGTVEVYSNVLTEGDQSYVPRPRTLLGMLQDDIEANRAPSKLAKDSTDSSIQIHSCHGAARQVQVLREVIVGLLADDPTLEPRDIVIMCPDIEHYAPLIEAAFGLGGPHSAQAWHPGQQLQVRLADRSLVQTNPLLALMNRLLEVAGGRAEASVVLDIAASPGVRRRFRFTEDDLDTLKRWIEDTGVRWAFDAAHRQAFGLGSVLQNTWRFGMDRLLAGVAVSADADTYLSTTLPYDDVGSSDIDLVGRFAEFVERLATSTDRLTGSHPVADWATALREGVGDLTEVGYDEQWQLHQAEREITLMMPYQSAGDTTLALSDVRAMAGARWVGRPTRANFRTGSLTVCTMVPMRSVPHRVVCLLGIDDGVFPRSHAADGDDVLQRLACTGERDIRSEDRQLLLDAVMAATEHLVLTYSGAHEVSGQARPPAVAVAELLDTVSLMTGHSAASVVTRHPLQPFDRRNFIPDALSSSAPFSFDETAKSAAVAALTPRSKPARFAETVLPAGPTKDIDVAELGAFLRAPVKEFLRRRVGLDTFENDDEIIDAIPIEVAGIDEWSVGSRILDDRLRGLSPTEALNMEWRRGQLPPGRMGWRLAQQIAERAEPIAAAASNVAGGSESSSVEVDAELSDDRRLTGAVTGVFGDRAITTSYSRLSARHYLDAWLDVLALAVSHPDVGWTAGAIARERHGAAMVAFNPLDVDQARAFLADLVALYDLGMTQPLRLPLKTSFALIRRGESAPMGARGQWEGRYAERDRDQHPTVWGPAASFDVLRAGADQLTIDALAERLWRPIVQRVAYQEIGRGGTQ